MRAELAKEFKARLAKGRAASSARLRWLESPRVRAARLRSRTAFHGLAAGSAESLLSRQFGGALKAADASPAASVAAAGRVVRYLGAFRAVVVRPDGKRLLYISTTPLRTSAGPVDLRVRPAGQAFSPTRSAVPLSVGDRLSDGVTVGPGVRLVLGGADSSGRLAGQNSVFYPGVGTDTDAVVTPTAEGVDLSAVLRSTFSPQVLRYRLVLPSGLHARVVSGSVVVYRGSRSVLVIHDPAASDAQGTPVPVSMSLVGDQLVLTVRHRRLSVAYPVLVDPQITVPPTSSGWQWSSSLELGAYPAGVGCGTANPPATATTAGPGQISIYGGEFGNPNYCGTLEAGWTWYASAAGLGDMTYVEFDDISTSVYNPGSTNPWQYQLVVGPTGDAWQGGSCPMTEGDPEGRPVPVSSTEVWQGSDCGYSLSENASTDSYSGNAQLQVGSVLVAAPLAPPSTLPDLGFDYGGGPQEADPNWITCNSGSDPVNCATGDLYTSRTDLSLSGRGLPFALTRTYDAQAAVSQTSPGSFGYGWSSSYSDQLVFSSETIPLCTSSCSGYSDDSGGLPSSGPTVLAGGAGWTIYQNPDGEVYEDLSFATVGEANGSEVSFWNGGSTFPAVDPYVQATLAGNDDGTYTYTLPDQKTERFGAGGRLLSESDRDGNTLTMGYDSAGNLTSVTDSAGRSITFARNSDGTVSSATGPMGTVRYGYDSDGNLTSVTALDGGQWLYDYDSSHRLTSETDALGHTITTTYNAANQVVSQTDTMGRTWSWSYPQDVPQEDPTAGAEVPAASETIITDPAGNQTDEQFQNGLPVSVTTGFGTSAAATRFMGYDQNSNLIQLVDGDGQSWFYGYDTSNNRISAQDPVGNTTTWTYDGDHDVTSMTDPNGNTTEYNYNAQNELTAASRTLSEANNQSQTQTTSYGYDAQGDLTSLTDADGNEWAYGYDPYGDLASNTGPTGQKTTWTYDQSGYQTSMVTPAGNAAGANPSDYTTTYVNDTYGRPTEITDPLGHQTQISYNQDGNQTSTTDPNGNATSYSYDADNELATITRADKTTLTNGYDSDGHLTNQTDGAGQTTSYGYDVSGQLVSTTDPMGRTTNFGYDSAGHLINKTDPEGRTTYYGYDPAGRLTSVGYSDGQTPSVSYTYDGDGHQTSMTDGTGTTTYSYDTLGRLISQTNGAGQQVSYGYDLDNHETSITYPDGNTITRAYNTDAQLAGITDWLGNTTTFAYDPNSNLTSTTFPQSSSNVDDYSYNRADQLTGIQFDQGSSEIAAISYTRDPLGQVSTESQTGLPGSTTAAYTYTPLNQLATAGDATFAYDQADNPTTLDSNAGYTYDQANELTSSPASADPNQSSPVATSYGYDQLGERTSATQAGGSPTDYTYDQAGRLTNVSQTASYTYDGNGLRATSTAGESTQQFAWDESGANPLLLTDGSTNYIYDDDGLPIEQIAADGTILYYHHDQLGSTRALTTSTGGTAATYTYDTYGNLTGKTGSADTPLRWAGQYQDASTGLYYMRARYYDPQTGQFLTRDPLAALTRQPYDYAAENPENITDPSGEIAPLVGCAVGEAIEPVGGCVAGAVGTTVATGLAALGGWLFSTESSKSGDQTEPNANAPSQPDVCNTLFDNPLTPDQPNATEDAGAAAGDNGEPGITFGHGARHLAGTGLDQTDVEGAIEAQVKDQASRASSTGSFWGRVEVDGQTIEYRAYTLPDGTINVGTYYVP